METAADDKTAIISEKIEVYLLYFGNILLECKTNLSNNQLNTEINIIINGIMTTLGTIASMTNAESGKGAPNGPPDFACADDGINTNTAHNININQAMFFIVITKKANK
jgi:hypothetical protein